jgi:hypothetical protein|tara:strand:- start:686 stop:1192 length:507 start_codon:yes stop_codon:yes gene_type:complete
MENKLNNKTNFLENFIPIIKKNKNIIILAIITIIVIWSFVLFLIYHQENKNKIISEKYITANIYLSNKDKDKSLSIYKEIISSKNKFYSYLALNNIIENKLELNSEEILKLFKIVESIKIDKEQKNLIKLKKALYLIKISKIEEGNKLLKEIINNNSLWKDTAKELLE